MWHLCPGCGADKSSGEPRATLNLGTVLLYMEPRAISWYVQSGLSLSSYLSTSTKSSRRRAHLDFGQNTRTRQPASRLSSMWRAWASWFTVCREGRYFVFGAGVCPDLRPKNCFKSQPKEKKPFLQSLLAYLDALLLIRALRLQISLVFIGAFHTQEAVCGVANSTGQHSVPQHGINHCAFTITGPEREH